jgi:hypothetical protein
MSNSREIMLTASPQYLIKRHQAYYCRRRPLVLRRLFSRLEFIISLKTTHFQSAKGIKPVISPLSLRLFDRN